MSRAEINIRSVIERLGCSPRSPNQEFELHGASSSSDDPKQYTMQLAIGSSTAKSNSKQHNLINDENEITREAQEELGEKNDDEEEEAWAVGPSSQIQFLETNLEKLHTEWLKDRKRIEDMQKENHALRETISLYKQRVNDIKATLEQIITIREAELQNEDTGASSSSITAQQQHTKQKRLLENLVTEQQLIQADSPRLQKELHMQRKAYEDLQFLLDKEREMHSKQLDKRDQHIQKLKLAQTSLESEKQQLHSDLTKLHNESQHQIHQLQHQLEALQTQLHERSTNILHLQEQLQENETRFQQQQKQKQDELEQLRLQNKQVLHFDREKRTLNETIVQCQEKMQANKAITQQKDEQIHQLHQEVHKLKDQLLIVNQQTEQKIKQFTENRNGFMKTIADLQQKNSHLQRTLLKFVNEKNA